MLEALIRWAMRKAGLTLAVELPDGRIVVTNNRKIAGKIADVIRGDSDVRPKRLEVRD